MIPQSCVAEFTASGDVEERFKDYSDKIKRRYKEADPGMALVLDSMECDGDFISNRDTMRVLGSLISCPNGPLESDGHGVRTSSNIGIIASSTEIIKTIVKPRSSDDKTLKDLVARISASFKGSEIEYEEPFPAWLEPEDAPIVITAAEAYRRTMGREPRITTVHGGLESSVIKSKHPGMTAISIGPTIIGAHTPEERMDVSTLREMRRYLFELVKELSKERSLQRPAAFHHGPFQTIAAEEGVRRQRGVPQYLHGPEALALVEGLGMNGLHRGGNDDRRHTTLDKASGTDLDDLHHGASDAHPVRNEELARIGAEIRLHQETSVAEDPEAHVPADGLPAGDGGVRSVAEVVLLVSAVYRLPEGPHLRAIAAYHGDGDVVSGAPVGA
ncbi:MAG: M20/M25/M40 family metallo-hydrolase, partial [Candidatus Methanomethylophilaceae archaeon]|nr:M20/M25/M40 family metallo-hydrolase [Candidatus Methanomethylophilaceae archaeon]